MYNMGHLYSTHFRGISQWIYCTISFNSAGRVMSDGPAETSVTK